MKRLYALLVVLLVATAYFAPLLAQQQQTPTTTSTGVPLAPTAGTLPTVAAGAPSTSAVVTTTIPSPAGPAHPMDQVIWALACSMLIRFLKKQQWFALWNDTTEKRVQVFFGFLVAAMTAAGIHFAVTGNFLDGGVNVTVTGLSMDAMKDVGFQWISQQAWYEALVKKNNT